MQQIYNLIAWFESKIVKNVAYIVYNYRLLKGFSSSDRPMASVRREVNVCKNERGNRRAARASIRYCFCSCLGWFIASAFAFGKSNSKQIMDGSFGNSKNSDVCSCMRQFDFICFAISCE